MGKLSAITTPTVNNQLTQTSATTLKTAIVDPALFKYGVRIHKQESPEIIVNIRFRACKGLLPFRTIRSESIEVPTAPTSAIKNGIHPNIPICANVKPDSS